MLGSWTHPRTESHESSVHTLASSQSTVVPLLHVPPEHVSPTVQALPSSQRSLLSTLAHVFVPRSQLSVVHSSASSQSESSSQQPGIGSFSQRFTIQSSSVHGLASSQSAYSERSPISSDSTVTGVASRLSAKPLVP